MQSSNNHLEDPLNISHCKTTFYYVFNNCLLLIAIRWSKGNSVGTSIIRTCRIFNQYFIQFFKKYQDVVFTEQFQYEVSSDLKSFLFSSIWQFYSNLTLDFILFGSFWNSHTKCPSLGNELMCAYNNILCFHIIVRTFNLWEKFRLSFDKKNLFLHHIFGIVLHSCNWRLSNVCHSFFCPGW